MSASEHNQPGFNPNFFNPHPFYGYYPKNLPNDAQKVDPVLLGGFNIYQFTMLEQQKHQTEGINKQQANVSELWSGADANELKNEKTGKKWQNRNQINNNGGNFLKKNDKVGQKPHTEHFSNKKSNEKQQSNDQEILENQERIEDNSLWSRIAEEGAVHEKIIKKPNKKKENDKNSASETNPNVKNEEKQTKTKLSSSDEAQNTVKTVKNQQFSPKKPKITENSDQNTNSEHFSEEKQTNSSKSGVSDYISRQMNLKKENNDKLLQASDSKHQKFDKNNQNNSIKRENSNQIQKKPKNETKKKSQGVPDFPQMPELKEESTTITPQTFSSEWDTQLTMPKSFSPKPDHKIINAAAKEEKIPEKGERKQKNFKNKEKNQEIEERKERYVKASSRNDKTIKKDPNSKAKLIGRHTQEKRNIVREVRVQNLRKQRKNQQDLSLDQRELEKISALVKTTTFFDAFKGKLPEYQKKEEIAPKNHPKPHQNPNSSNSNPQKQILSPETEEKEEKIEKDHKPEAPISFFLAKRKLLNSMRQSPSTQKNIFLIEQKKKKEDEKRRKLEEKDEESSENSSESEEDDDDEKSDDSKSTKSGTKSQKKPRISWKNLSQLKKCIQREIKLKLQIEKKKTSEQSPKNEDSAASETEEDNKTTETPQKVQNTPKNPATIKKQTLGDNQTVDLIEGDFINDYVDQKLAVELNQQVKNLLSKLYILQQNVKKTNPLKYMSKKRLVLGIREAQKNVKAGEMKCVILCPNLQKYDVVKNLLTSFIAICQDKKVPVVFALNYKKAHEIFPNLPKQKHLSCMGILKTQGADAEYTTMMALATKLRALYYEEKQKQQIKEQEQPKPEETKVMNELEHL